MEEMEELELTYNLEGLKQLLKATKISNNSSNIANNNVDISSLSIQNSKGKTITIKKISNKKDLHKCVRKIQDYLTSLPEKNQMLAVDLEGEKLGRNGTLALLQLYPYNYDVIYIVDIHELKHAAFANPTYSLTPLLQSKEFTKLMWDPRADSDALYNHYGVVLQKVICCQLMNAAYRVFYQQYNMKFVMGLATAIEKDLSMNYQLRRQLIKMKQTGKELFDPKMGGSYRVFSDRPLLKDVILYCCVDVVLLPDLYEVYHDKIKLWFDKVKEESQNRVNICYRRNYSTSAACPFYTPSFNISRYLSSHYDDDFY